MNLPIEFMFRHKLYRCMVFIDSSSHPCFLFVELQDAALIAEFGEDITIKTDFEKRLSKKDDYPALIELRQCIFDFIQQRPEFIAARQKKEYPNKSDSTFLGQHPSS